MVFTRLSILICLIPAMSLAAILGDSTSLQLYNASAIAKSLVASSGKDISVRFKRAVAAPSEEQSLRFKKLMKLIEAGKLQDCVGRVVCDLNCDLAGYGADGKRVLATLTRLQTSGLIERDDMDFYVRAGVLGRKGSTRRKDCSHVCKKAYPACPVETKDLVSVAALIKLHT